MIVSFRDKRTRVRRRQACKDVLGLPARVGDEIGSTQSWTTIRDLSVLTGNWLEALQGDRKGQYSIRINDQWRICFEWESRSPGPVNVEIVEYH